MATDKLFTVVGTSKLNGEVKVRFATDIMRTKVLQKHGHTDIVLVELDTAMTKIDAVRAIKDGDEFQSAAQQAAIADYLDAKAPKAPKAPATPKAKAPAKAPKAAKSTAKVDLSDIEDAPF